MVLGETTPWHPGNANRCSLAGLPVIATVLAAGLNCSGRYSIGADDLHTGALCPVSDALRTPAIVIRANDLQAPVDLDDRARVVQGPGDDAAT